MIIVDTNILIDALQGRSAAVELLTGIGRDATVLSSIVVGELYQGAVNRTELIQLKRLLSGYHTIHVNEKIAKLANELLFDYTLSHGLKLPDALIAATTILTNYELATYNVKDFHYIQGVRLYSLS